MEFALIKGLISAVAASALLIAVYFLFKHLKDTTPPVTYPQPPPTSFIHHNDMRFNEFRAATVSVARDVVDSATGLSEEQKTIRSEHREDVVDILLLCGYNHGAYSESQDRINTRKAIQDMHAAIGPRFYNKQTIVLSGTKLTRIPHEALGIFENLTTLHLEFCDLPGDFNCLHVLPKLERLYFNGNNLTALPDLSSFKSLRRLDVGQNQELKIGRGVEMGSLEMLRIANTGMSINEVRQLREIYPQVEFVWQSIRN